MTAERSDRRSVKIRRRGRHTSPSQVEKVALQAGKAAPAVAIAGAIVAAPQAQHALAAQPASVTAQNQHTAASTDASTGAGTGAGTAALDAVTTRTVTVAATTTAKHAATASSTTYQVRSGDTLSKIASRFYNNAGDWQYLYHVNDTTLSNPNMILVGQSLDIPATVPANYTLPASYVPKHAAPATAAPAVAAVSDSSSSGQQDSGSAVHTVTQAASEGGMYSCSGLESLWEEAGGSSAEAFMAAEIAMAESGGNPSAISPTDDFGLWQINGSNGSLATLDALQNAKSAITLSDNGSNWGAWTTYTSGAYSGKC